MKKRLTALVIGISMLTGCATPPVKIRSKFNVQDVEWVKQQGSSTVQGQAFLRTVGGDVKTCAGYSVNLVPASEYSSERIRVLYGNNIKGFHRFGMYSNNRVPVAPHPEYMTYAFSSHCDANGKFEFENVPSGDFFLVTKVAWKVRANDLFWQGGLLMQKITVKPNSSSNYILSPY